MMEIVNAFPISVNGTRAREFLVWPKHLQNLQKYCPPFICLIIYFPISVQVLHCRFYFNLSSFKYTVLNNRTA